MKIIKAILKWTGIVIALFFLMVVGIFVVAKYNTRNDHERYMTAKAPTIDRGTSYAAYGISERVYQKHGVTADRYGKEWPFIVNSITLFCVSPSAVLMETPDGKIYTLNGKAQGRFKELPTFRSITKPGSFPGSVMTLPDDLISMGLALCQ